MTISYFSDGDNFLRVLFRWKGSAWKAVWKEILLWLCLYYGIKVILGFSLTSPEDQQQAKKLVDIFDGFTRKIPLEFLLGFYVVQVVSRWWQQIQRLPWPDDIMSHITALFPTQTREFKLKRHTVARYLILCEVLALRDISTRVRKRFPTVDTLLDAGLMVEEELRIYNECPDPYTKWQLPIQWIISSIIQPSIGMEPGKIPPVGAVQLVNQLNAFKASLRDLFIYDWICIPLVYTQTISVVVYGYFALCLIGHQFYGKEIDIYIPVLTILQFFFYVGWLKVAQDLMRPFGEDDDDVELNWMLDRHVAVAFNLGFYASTNIPNLTEDPMFLNHVKLMPDGKEQGQTTCVRLQYSKMSTKGAKDHQPKLHANVPFRQHDQIEMIFKTVSSAQNPSLTRSATVTENGRQFEITGTPNHETMRRCKSLGDWIKNKAAIGPKSDQIISKECNYF